MKYYFRNEDSERCHPIAYFKDDMRENGITEMEVFIAVPEKDPSIYYCKAIDEPCMKGEEYTPCGKDCPDYEPRNGKNGRCRYHTHCYTHGEKVTIKIKEEPK